VSVSLLDLAIGEATEASFSAREKLFVLGEVAVELFQESPSACLSELRNGRYVKTASSNKSILHTIHELGLPTESVTGMGAGVTLVPAQTVEQLLQDKRKVNTAAIDTHASATLSSFSHCLHCRA
jgi:hypothetical protein